MARSFNGSTDLIDCGSSAVLIPPAITISCWVNPTGYPSSYAGIVCNDNGTASIVQTFLKADGTLAMYVGSVHYDGGGVHTLSLGTWYNVICVYSNSIGFLTGYVNGSFDGSVATSGALGAGTGDLQFGCESLGPSRKLNGLLADVGIWSTGLGAGEIAALAAGARPHRVRRGSLIGYWPLNGTSSPEPDLSGNAFNGTLTGTSLAASGPPVAMFTPRVPSFLDIVTTSAIAPCFRQMSVQSHPTIWR